MEIHDQGQTLFSLAARRPEENPFDGRTLAVVPGDGLDLGQGRTREGGVEISHRAGFGQAVQAAGHIDLGKVTGVAGGEGDHSPIS